MRLEALTDPDLVFPDLAAPDAETALRRLTERLVARGVAADAADVFGRLWEREQLGSTGIGGGVAIPHCKLPGLERVVVAIGLAPAGVDFNAVDGQPVRVFFLVVSPANAPAAHLQSLAAISKWVKADRHVPRLLELHDVGEIYRLLSEAGD